ncbi:hypothetical protein H7Q97_08320 [Ochrobactrum sp. CM-21-5]|nr:hypothetical protein [Ochrobactrum sp. CM-21-5]MBC2885411.1 hypothetical protein [Ochrobactrum sp. CM-21-5]
MALRLRNEFRTDKVGDFIVRQFEEPDRIGNGLPDVLGRGQERRITSVDGFANQLAFQMIWLSDWWPQRQSVLARISTPLRRLSKPISLKPATAVYLAGNDLSAGQGIAYMFAGRVGLNDYGTPLRTFGATDVCQRWNVRLTCGQILVSGEMRPMNCALYI